MFSEALATIHGRLATISAAICVVAFMSMTTAEANDLHYETYSGETVRIDIDYYGQTQVEFTYANGLHGRLEPDWSSANLDSFFYTSDTGFVGTDSFSYTAYNGNSAVATDTVYITVKPKVTFSESSWPNGIKGVAYSQTVTATYSGGSTTVTYSVTAGSLPSGLSLNTSTGAITGTPTSSGLSTFTYVAENADGYIASQSMTMKIAPNPTDVTATVAANSSGTAIALALSGSEAVTAVSAPNHGTAVVSGSALTYTPTVGYSGADSFAYTVTDNASGLSNTATVSVTVSAPVLSISPSTLAGGTVGTAYSQVLSAANGTAAYRFDVTAGSLPAGVALSSGGALSGTPTTPESRSFTVSATDAYGATGSQSYTIAIAVAPPVANDINATVAANSGSNSISLGLTGGAATSVAVASAPSHGTATASGTSISYTPSPGYSGYDSFTYTATNASGTSAAATATMTVSQPTLTISPSTLPAGTATVAYSQTLSATSGTTPYSFAVTGGALPAGMTLASSGLLSGTPTVEQDQSFTVTATDAHGATGSQVYTLTIAIAAPVAGDVAATVSANSSDNDISLNISGGAAASVAIVTTPTHGTTITTGSSISYTPAVGYSGADSFTYSATNATGTSSPATVAITISQPTLSISPTGTLTLRESEAFSQAFTTTNGMTPYSYSLAGALPGGLTFDSAEGVLAGTATDAGSFPLTLTATDRYGAAASASITLSVSSALPVAPSVSSSTNSGRTVMVDLTKGATGGPFTGASLISLSPASAGTAVIVLEDTAASSGATAFAAAYAAGRYKLRFTANPDFTGTAVATYTLTGASGTSAPAAIQFIVTARPILSSDADLVGLVQAQATAAKRLADAQIDNVEDHLKSLRSKTCLENNLSVVLTDSAEGQAPLSGNAGCSALSNGDLAFWTAGSVRVGDSDSLNGESGFDYATVSLTGGLDYRLSDTVIGGVAVGYSRDRNDIGDKGTTSLNKAASASLYGVYQPGGGAFVDGLLGAGLLDFDSLRITSATGAQAEASRTGRQVFAAIGGGYDHRKDDLSVTTYGRLSASHSHLDRVEEDGAGWESALFDKQRTDSLTATLGFSIGYDVNLEDMVLTPELTLDFSHDFLDISETSVTYAEAGWPIDYVIPGSTTNRDRLDVGLGMTLVSGSAGTIAGRYRATLDRDGLQSQRFSLNMSRQF